jgi:hypothetical protein
LLLSASTFTPSVTRAPIVPAVIAGWPMETPIGTGSGHRSRVLHTASPLVSQVAPRRA